MDNRCRMVTARAPVNIALIKYWGKRDEEYILPLHDSISATLSKKQMCAQTTIAVSPTFTEDRIWLNGQEDTMENPRLKNCLREIKKWAHDQKSTTDEVLKWHVHICSENNFPTAAGLASSAAGFACLVFALGRLYQVEGDLSVIARQGSGSACRSMYGGFVQWHMGNRNDGADSLSTQLASNEHWPEMRILVLMVSTQQKLVSSTHGMHQSVLTSEFLKYRASSIVPRRIKEITRAIFEKDFHTLSEITMKDSNQFHAVCQDTYPSIRYMNDISWDIVKLIHEYNSFYGENKVAYTFDAGSNACLFILEKNVPELVAVMKHYFPPAEKEYIIGLPVPVVEPPQAFIQKYQVTPKPGAFKKIIYTQVGSGPKVIEDNSMHLLDEKGSPKFLQQ